MLPMTWDTLHTLPPRPMAGPSADALPRLSALHRVLWVHAPAGYGKTAWLTAGYHRLRDLGARVAWLEWPAGWGEATPPCHTFAPTLLNHLAQALGVPASAVADATPTTAVARLVAALPAQDPAHPLHLFIDGLDALRHTPAEALLAQLIDASGREGGPAVRWLLASRGTLGLPLARLGAAGQLLAWGASDLQLGPTQAAALLTARAATPLPPATLDHALQQADGWPAGLRLLAQGLHTDGPLAPQAESCPRAVAAYLHDEVYRRLDPTLQAWLPALGVLTRLTAPLCDAVTGRNDSHLLLERLHAEGGLLAPLDPTAHTWRLHPLFAAYLAGLLAQQPGRCTQVHQRASRWHAVQGQVAQALAHAERSGDAAFLAQTLDRSWDTVNRQGAFSRMLRLARLLPRELLVRHPRVLMWQALYLAVERRFEEAQGLLDQVERRLAPAHTPPGDEAAELRYTLAHRRMSLAMFRDDLVECEQLAAQLRQHGPCPDPYLQALAQLAELVVSRQHYRLAEGEALAYASQTLLMDLGHAPGLVWHACAVGPLLMQRGQVKGAALHYRRAVAEADTLPSVDPADQLASMPLALLAEALLEQGDLTAARDAYAQAHAGARPIGPLDVTAALLLGHARLASHDGDHATAHSLLDRAHTLALSRAFERLRWAVLHERVRQQLARGEHEGARESARAAGLPQRETALMPHAGTTLSWEPQALAWARLALASGRSAAALRVMRAWTNFAQPRGAVGTVVRCSLLCAAALHAQGELRAAQRAVARALAQAGDGGLVLTFVQEAEPVRSLLLASLEAAPPEARERLLALLKPSLSTEQAPAHHSPAPEALNAREVDILRLAARGLLYKEIGHRLGLTEGSVKWYMQQIYAKLGVRRRLPAIEKGAVLGYL